MDNACLVYNLNVVIKAKDPPWFAGLKGSVADSVAANIDRLLGLSKPFAKKMIAGIKQSVPITARRCVINDVRPERLYLSGDIQNGTRDDIIYDGVASSGFDFNTLREDKEQLKEELRSIVLPVSKDRIGLYQIAVTTKSNVKVYIYEDPNKFPSDLFEMTYSTDEILQALEQSMKMP